MARVAKKRTGEKKSTKKKVIHKLRRKYRLIMYNDANFEEVWHLRLSGMNVLSVMGTFVLIVMLVVVLLVCYTPIREIIPGYPSTQMRQNIVLSALRVDSLENELKIKDQYISNLNAIVRGEEPKNPVSPGDKSISTKKIKFTKSRQDSLLRKRVEEEDRLSFFAVNSNKKVNNEGISNLIFFAPLRGIITSSFNPGEGHLGTDIVTKSNNAVMATLDGTVIMANWTIETGYVIEIQHNNNLVSIYKHNATLLKRMGDHVKAGEAIAIVGNSGELTTGPHLHFELWYNGKPVNPEQYIVF
ncbi:MAG: M23 family metallopeptidase [Bacteroidota bacterium]|nr:M23 family metallopeptidase [Bacteroidota bacterium]